MPKQTVIGTHVMKMAEDEIWPSPDTVAVVLHAKYTFNDTPIKNVIELKGLDYCPGTAKAILDEHSEAIEMMTASDARALAALLIKAADAAEA